MQIPSLYAVIKFKYISPALINHMITLDLKNAIKEKEISKKANLIKNFLDKIEKRKQGFYKVLDDKNVIKEINDFTKRVKGKYEDIVVLGIGGSALGTICLQKVLRHPNPARKQSPHLHILDNIDPTVIKAVEENINLKKTLFIVISKSGDTAETFVQYLYFNQKVLDKKLDPKNHFVFITGEKGMFRTQLKKENIPTFSVPENVGGRFSVLTNVGLLPAKLIGIDIEKLLEGAKEMRRKFLSASIKENTPFRLALTQYLLEKKGKKINVLFPYYDEFSHLNNWYIQLLSESIGKKGKGITPVSAIGVKDQHSQLQLWNEGPNDKLIMFLEVEKFKNDMLIPNHHKNIPELKKFFKKQFSFLNLMKLEKQGTEASLTHHKRPNLTIKTDEVSEKTLGELLMLFECSIAFLGEFYSINAYNQPGVELSKKITKQLLQKHYA